MPVLALAILAMGVQFSPSDFFYQPAALMKREDVRKELKIRRDQDKKRIEIDKRLDKTIKETRGDIAKSMVLLNEWKAADLDTLAYLDEGQRSRLKQIQLQGRGPLLWIDKDYVGVLELTRDQIATIKTARAKANSDYFALAQTGKLDLRKIEEFNESFESVATAALTEAQKLKLSELKGESFEAARQKGLPIF